MRTKSFWIVSSGVMGCTLGRELWAIRSAIFENWCIGCVIICLMKVSLCDVISFCGFCMSLGSVCDDLFFTSIYLGDLGG